MQITIIICATLIAIAYILKDYACKHKWKKIKEVTVEDYIGGRWTRYFLECEKCGSLKSKNMR